MLVSAALLGAVWQHRRQRRNGRAASGRSSNRRARNPRASLSRAALMATALATAAGEPQSKEMAAVNDGAQGVILRWEPQMNT
eukprot:831817-Pyramimonas_sp.AAC.1